MKRSLWIFLLPAVLFIQTSPVFAQNRTAEIDAVVDSIMTHTHIPGMIVSVGSEDFTYEKAFGYADITHKVPMTTDKIFRIGSVTKTFTLTVILQLVDEGKLKLDEPITRFFPDFPNGKNITVRMLGNMTSGIYNYSEPQEFLDSLDNHPLKKWSDEELVQIALRYPAYSAPGDTFHYSNTNTVMLGMIVKKITGNSLGIEIKKRIIDKLALKNTCVPTDQFLPGDYSHGFNSGDSLVLPYEDYTVKIDPSWASAAGYVISNVHDLKIYAEALACGKLVSKKSQKERLKWLGLINPQRIDYGLGIYKLKDGYLGHNGGIPGFTNTTVYSPKKKCSIIVMFNVQISNLSTDRLAMRIMDIMNSK